jgi:hypothetical protein
VIYGVSKVLLPRDLPDLPQIPPPMIADVAAVTAVWEFNFLVVLLLFSCIMYLV